MCEKHNHATNFYELHPKNCIIRLCRFCISPMKLLEYDWDSDFRWYTFYCRTCDNHTQVSEPLSPEFMEDWKSIPHEPKTSEENENFIRGNTTHV